MNEKPTPLAFATFEEFKKAEAEYNKNIETKLTAKVKVELSLAKDISALTDELDKEFDISIDLINDGEKRLEELARARDIAESVSEEIELQRDLNERDVNAAEKLIAEAEKITDNLGIAVDDLPGFVELEDKMIELRNITEDLERVESELDDVIGR